MIRLKNPKDSHIYRLVFLANSIPTGYSHKQLSHARKVTYVMGRGSDTYETLTHFLGMDGAEVLLRTYVDRRGQDLKTGQRGRLSDLLAAAAW